MLTRTITERHWRYLALAVMSMLAVIVALTFQDYGISWDEELQSQYGQAVYDYYASGFSDHRFEQIFNLYLYGGMFDGLAALFDAYSSLSIYETRHLLNAVLGLAGLWGTWRLGRLLGGGGAGLAALLLLALTPAYYGHMFNNPKDIPFAAGIIWTMYYMVRSLRIFPKILPQLVIKLGIVFGLTLGIRVGGVMLLGYWGLSLLLRAVILYRSELPEHLPVQKSRRALALCIKMAALGLPVGILTYAVMLICWPWAQESPIQHPIEAFIQFSNFPQIVEVLFNGATYLSTELPWYYVPTFLSVQLPLPQLIIITTSLLLLPLLLRGLNSSADRIAVGLILLTVVVPISYAMLRHPALYDAIRHFTFTIPMLCVVAGLGFRNAVKFCVHRLEAVPSVSLRRVVAVAAGVFMAAVAALHINTMIRLHPYEYIYINALHGGVKGSFGKYEMDYWGSSFKEAAEKLQAFVNAEGGVPPGKIYQVAICGPWSAAMIYLPPDYEAVEADKPADFFLSTTRWMCEDMRQGKEIVRVARMGVPLSIIKDLRQ